VHETKESEKEKMLSIGIICLFVVCTVISGSDAACSSKDFPQFQCTSDGKCIDQEFTCNGINDCSDGSDESLSNCTNGCLFNGTLIKQGETGQDPEWWYTCTKSRWLISGCVINGQRYKLGDTFQLLTRQGIFWGKCEKLDQYHYMRQPYGCVDKDGKNIDNGQRFQMNQLFWGVCSLNKTTTKAPEVGSVTVNDVKWKITGCNDGSQKQINDGQEFIWIIDPFRLLGVQIKCQLPKKENEWPDIKPTACVVNVPSNSATPAAAATSSSAQPIFKVLRHKCYSPIDKLLYYCTITPKATTVPPQLVGKISTWDEDWLLNITDNTADELKTLKSKGFSECTESPKTPPVVPKIPLPPQGLPPPPSNPPSRQPTKREIKQNPWTMVDQAGSFRSIRSILSPRVSTKVLAKNIVV
jgi:hypothetical protein